jgi:hypothetical protein
MAICRFLGHSICNRNTPHAALIPLIAGILGGGAFGRRVMNADKSLLEHHQSLLGWEGRNYPLSMEDRDPWARLSEQSFSSRHLNRARHMAQQASSTRDQHAAGCLAGRSDDLPRGVLFVCHFIMIFREGVLPRQAGGKLDSHFLCLS